jgi:hypothetical protein
MRSDKKPDWFYKNNALLTFNECGHPHSTCFQTSVCPTACVPPETSCGKACWMKQNPLVQPNVWSLSMTALLYTFRNLKTETLVDYFERTFLWDKTVDNMILTSDFDNHTFLVVESASFHWRFRHFVNGYTKRSKSHQFFFQQYRFFKLSWWKVWVNISSYFLHAAVIPFWNRLSLHSYVQ